jgi:hypothetical protein
MTTAETIPLHDVFIAPNGNVVVIVIGDARIDALILLGFGFW